MKLTRKPTQAVKDAAAFCEKAKAFKETIGEVLPAKSPKETGRGKKTTQPDCVVFDHSTIAAYRKIAANKDNEVTR